MQQKNYTVRTYRSLTNAFIGEAIRALPENCKKLELTEHIMNGLSHAIDNLTKDYRKDQSAGRNHLDMPDPDKIKWYHNPKNYENLKRALPGIAPDKAIMKAFNIVANHAAIVPRINGEDIIKVKIPDQTEELAVANI